VTLLNRLRDFVRGVTRVSYGSCGGDPIAWEKDLILRRIRAKDESSDPEAANIELASNGVKSRHAASSHVATVGLRKP